jgi:dCTP diphosphatase
VSELSALARELETFAIERHWPQFHSPKNLAMALAGEVGALVSIFQWKTEAESAHFRDPAHDERDRVEDELADVLIYLTRLADVLDIDLGAAARQKIERNRNAFLRTRARGDDLPP